MAKTLRPPKAPNLPVGPVAYEQNYQNQLNNIQRLYYNTIDNTLISLMENSGGRYISFPHLFLSDSTTQYATGDDTPTLVKWNTTERNEGFVITLTSANPEFSGAYRIDYRLQFENSDAAAHQVYVWAVVNSSNIARSTTKFTVQPTGASESYTVAYSFIQKDLTGADTIQLYWATDKAASSGGATGVYMEAYAAQTSPYSRPAIPSAYGSITFVSELSQ